MALLVQTVVEDALALIGAFEDGGGGPAPEWQTRAVRCLNMLLGEWSRKSYINPRQTTWTLSSLKDFHKIVLSPTAGTDVDLVADVLLISSIVVELGTATYQMREMRIEDYNGLSVKDLQAIPRAWAWDRNFPSSTIWIYPGFSASKIRITGMPKITSAVSQGTIDVPDDYYKAVVYNLAAEMHPFFPKDSGIDTGILAHAKAALKPIKMAAQNRLLNTPQAGQYSSNGPGSDYWLSPLNDVVLR